MANIAAIIEANELHFMQSWMHRDAGSIRQLATRDFMMMLGTKPPELLDRPSFVAGIEQGFRCTGFRLGESFVRKYGRLAWYVAGAQLELKLGAKDWSGDFIITDLWRKARIGGWKLAERSLAPTNSDDDLDHRIRKLQLWR
ncbi:Cif family virulence factor [Erythrobacter rubeus]|uniref:DUF4440 domain-containing protein n=1 Tax=Erythrobacter rubeus TaxID=2760803 RepID=A0ABR8KSH1_9SPHN|nr:nuclear transport factor 2 family protein [Erythrobacter rubeus]MBD2842013.1 DUF4440 domain-containing protein [Erythrobacter rubeus]